MHICKVVGKVVSTIKDDRLVGTTLVLVQKAIVGNGGKLTFDKETLVAADQIGSGNGDLVLVSAGAAARLGLKNNNAPVDLAVVGIVDSTEE